MAQNLIPRNNYQWISRLCPSSSSSFSSSGWWCCCCCCCCYCWGLHPSALRGGKGRGEGGILCFFQREEDVACATLPKKWPQDICIIFIYYIFLYIYTSIYFFIFCLCLFSLPPPSSLNIQKILPLSIFFLLRFSCCRPIIITVAALFFFFFLLSFFPSWIQLTLIRLFVSPLIYIFCGCGCCCFDWFCWVFFL